MGLHRRLYEWTIHWAQTPRATQALALIAFAESSFFPVPPDVLLIAMCLAQQPDVVLVSDVDDRQVGVVAGKADFLAPVGWQAV